MKDRILASSDGASRRSFDAFFLFFVTGILIIGWGRTAYYVGNNKVFSFGGNTGGIIYPLFFLYACHRFYSKDLRPAIFWKDPLFILSLYAIISPAWSSLHDFSYVKGYILPALLAYWMSSYLLREFQRFRIAFLTLIFSFIALVVLRALFELPFIPAAVSIMHSTVEHHTIIAMLIVTAIPLVIGVLQAKGPYPFLYYLSLCIFGLGIFLTSSRIGWITFFALTSFYIWKARDLKKRILILMILAALFSFCLLIFPDHRDRFFTLGHLSADRETGTRLENWRICSLLIRGNPVFGIGYSNEEYIKKAREYMDHFQYNHPHNIVLQLFAYLGLIGFALFLPLLSRIIRALQTFAKTGQSAISDALQAALLGMAVMNMADSALNSHRASLILYLLLAYLFKASENEPSNPS